MVEFKVLSQEAFCLRDKDVSRVPLKKNGRTYKVYSTICGYLGKYKLAPVMIEHKGIYLADKHGTLYDLHTLRAMTGGLYCES